MTEAEELLRAAETQVRRIAYDLRPAVLGDLGLIAAIRSLARRMRLTPGSV